MASLCFLLALERDGICFVVVYIRPRRAVIIMLHPRFFATPDNIELKPWQSFAIIGYSQVEDWTLVRWRLDYGFDGPNGTYLESESLYRGMELVASDRINGELPLYREVEAPLALEATSPWERVDRRLGALGVPPAIAIALRSVDNMHYFQAPAK